MIIIYGLWNINVNVWEKYVSFAPGKLQILLITDIAVIDRAGCATTSWHHNRKVSVLLTKKLVQQHRNHNMNRYEILQSAAKVS